MKYVLLAVGGQGPLSRSNRTKAKGVESRPERRAAGWKSEYSPSLLRLVRAVFHVVSVSRSGRRRERKREEGWEPARNASSDSELSIPYRLIRISGPLRVR